MNIAESFATLPSGVRVAVIVAVAALVGLVAHALIYRAADRLGRRIPALLVFDGALVQRTRAPARLLLPLLGIHWALPLLESVPASVLRTVDLVLHLLLIAAVAWTLIAVSYAVEDAVVRRFDVDVVDNLRARRVRTQIGLLRRVTVIAVAVFAASSALMRFEGFQALGTGLLASAGVIGIIISIAAQRPLGNLVAGVQLALTQPIRVGDAVVVENEWGTVEEITLTYVVVRIWDARRLVLPISHFFERPFQNWTRSSAQIIGTVFVYVDYSAPVAEIRAECERIVHESPHWDGNTFQLQVSDATERTMQLRAIMSASNASQAWDLRCEVREKLVDYLHRTHPDVLPRLRVAPTVVLDAAEAGVGRAEAGRG